MDKDERSRKAYWEDVVIAVIGVCAIVAMIGGWI